jgi:hypothetical protein
MLFTTNYKILCILCGAIAQLVERMDGIHEATGSNPVSSTRLRLSGTAASANYAWRGQVLRMVLKKSEIQRDFKYAKQSAG